MSIIKSPINKFKAGIREKAISRAETRIVIAGKKPEDFNPEELEIIVKEEEDKIYEAIKQRGLLATLALLGIGWFG